MLRGSDRGLLLLLLLLAAVVRLLLLLLLLQLVVRRLLLLLVVGVVVVVPLVADSKAAGWLRIPDTYHWTYWFSSCSTCGASASYCCASAVRPAAV
jgi:hypothetical protein